MVWAQAFRSFHRLFPRLTGPRLRGPAHHGRRCPVREAAWNAVVLHREGEAHAKLLAATALTLTSALAPATIINVKNCSPKAISANVPVMAAGHKELHGTLTPNATSGAWKSGGKVLVPHDHAVTTSAALHHVDASGAGCRFPLKIRRPPRRQRPRSARSWCRQPGSATSSCPVQ
jgi:hypothetical protein